MSVSAPPVRTAITGGNVPSLPWQKWFQSVTTTLASWFSGATGKPQDTAAPVAWAQLQIGAQTYWVPLYK